jgi:hypothetical protein
MALHLFIPSMSSDEMKRTLLWCYLLLLLATAVVGFEEKHILQEHLVRTTPITNEDPEFSKNQQKYFSATLVTTTLTSVTANNTSTIFPLANGAPEINAVATTTEQQHHGGGEDTLTKRKEDKENSHVVADTANIENNNEDEEEVEEEEVEEEEVEEVDSKNVVDNLIGAQNTVEQRKVDLSILKQRIGNLIDKEKTPTTPVSKTKTIQPKTIPTTNNTSMLTNKNAAAAAAAAAAGGSSDGSGSAKQQDDLLMHSNTIDTIDAVMDDYRSYEDLPDDESIFSSSSSSVAAAGTTTQTTELDSTAALNEHTKTNEATKQHNTTTTITTHAANDVVQEEEDDPDDAIDKWENSTLAKLEQFVQHQDMTKKKNAGATSNITHQGSFGSASSTTAASSGGGIFSTIEHWFKHDDGSTNVNTKDPQEVKKESNAAAAVEEKEKEKKKKEEESKTKMNHNQVLIQDLKASIKQQASKQRRERLKDKERLDTLQEVVQELTNMEKSMNRTEERLERYERLYKGTHKYYDYDYYDN